MNMKHFALPSLFSVLIAVLCLLAPQQATAQVRSTQLTELLADYTAQVSLSPNEVTVTINGPSDRWFGLGFGAQGMAPGTDVVFYANGSEGEGVYDGHLVGNAPPEEDEEQNWTVLSEIVVPGVRSLLITRELVTGDENDYNFDFDAASISIIFAYGAMEGFDLAYHQSNRGAEVLPFSEVLSTRELKPDIGHLVNIYPNPARDEINLSFGSDLILESYNIFDAQARLLQSGSLQGSVEMARIALNDLPSGIYFLEINSAGDRGMKRFVIE